MEEHTNAYWAEQFALDVKEGRGDERVIVFAFDKQQLTALTEDEVIDAEMEMLAMDYQYLNEHVIALLKAYLVTVYDT